MELSNVSIDSLNILLNSNIVSDEHFDELLLGCKALTLNGKLNDKSVTAEKNENENCLNIINAGIVYGNIVGLFVEAARHKYDTEHFVNFLRTSKLYGGPRAELLSTVYEEEREKLIYNLSIIGNHFPYIVDVNWRLDYCIKSNTNNSIIGCVYHIRLTIKKYGILDYIQFTCTRHQLQELIYKLRDAVRHLEKISHT